MKSSIVLCSGGIDSLTAALLMRQQGHLVKLLHINYGQITYLAEHRSLQLSTMELGLEEPLTLEVPKLASWGAGTLIGHQQTASTTEWFPHRNLFLVAAAVIVASSVQSRSIVSGIIDAENAVYTDCQWPFLRSCAETIHMLAPDIQFLNPLAHMTKRDVVQLAVKLEVPLGLTFSCNTRNDRHCWQCIGCTERRMAFEELGIDL